MYDPPPTYAPTMAPSISKALSMAGLTTKNTNETTIGVNNLTKDGESKYDYVGGPDDSSYSEKDDNEISLSNATMIDTGDGDKNSENNTAVEETDHIRLDDRDDESNLTGSHQHRNLWSSFVGFLYNRRLLDDMPNNSTDEVTPETTLIDIGDHDDDNIADLSRTSGDSLMNSTETDDAEGGVADNQAEYVKPIEEPVEEDPADAAIEAGEAERRLLYDCVICRKNFTNRQDSCNMCNSQGC